MSGEYHKNPKLKVGIVDVREVAYAQKAALMRPEAKDKRFILNSECIWLSDISRFLRDEFGDKY